MLPQNFKERFGLDYLNPDSVPAPAPLGGAPRSAVSSGEAQLPPGMESVIASFSGLILNQMKSAPNQEVNMFSLAQATSTRIDGLASIMHYLAGKGLVELIAEDPSGNDTYRVSATTASR